jgi:hypothetical protein
MRGAVSLGRPSTKRRFSLSITARPHCALETRQATAQVPAVVCDTLPQDLGLQRPRARRTIDHHWLGSPLGTGDTTRAQTCLNGCRCRGRTCICHSSQSSAVPFSVNATTGAPRNPSIVEALERVEALGCVKRASCLVRKRILPLAIWPQLGRLKVIASVISHRRCPRLVLCCEARPAAHVVRSARRPSARSSRSR